MILLSINSMGDPNIIELSRPIDRDTGFRITGFDISLPSFWLLGFDKSLPKRRSLLSSKLIIYGVGRDPFPFAYIGDYRLLS